MYLVMNDTVVAVETLSQYRYIYQKVDKLAGLRFVDEEKLLAHLIQKHQAQGGKVPQWATARLSLLRSRQRS